MRRLTVYPFPLGKEEISGLLEANGIHTNALASDYFSHPLFSAGETPAELPLQIVSLAELGLEGGAALPEILDRLPSRGLRPCRPAAGLYLRLLWRDQPRSGNSILSGQHASPDGAVTVLSLPLEGDDTFPKGLYLRNVDGTLWLRGYRCDADYLWSADDLFVLEEADVLE